MRRASSVFDDLFLLKHLKDHWETAKSRYLASKNQQLGISLPGHDFGRLIELLGCPIEKSFSLAYALGWLSGRSFAAPEERLRSG
jgi:hypothetical protein